MDESVRWRVGLQRVVQVLRCAAASALVFVGLGVVASTPPRGPLVLPVVVYGVIELRRLDQRLEPTATADRAIPRNTSRRR